MIRLFRSNPASRNPLPGKLLANTLSVNNTRTRDRWNNRGSYTEVVYKARIRTAFTVGSWEYSTVAVTVNFSNRITALKGSQGGLNVQTTHVDPTSTL